MELHERSRRPGRPRRRAGRDPFAEVKNRDPPRGDRRARAAALQRRHRPDALRERVIGRHPRRSSRARTGISRDDRERLVDEIADDILGHGPLERLLADDSVTEIMVNGPYDVWVERQGRLYETTVRFTDESHLRRIINKIVAQVGRRIDESSPMVDARLPDGSRVNAVLPPLSLTRAAGDDPQVQQAAARRSTTSIRLGTLTHGDRRLPRALRPRRAEHPDLRRHRLRQDDAAERAVDGDPGRPTASSRSRTRPSCGSTSATCCGSRRARRTSRARARSPIRELVRNSLRMRPDRIIVGEVRGAEALDMLQAMNTGHDGSLSTVHANTPRDALARIETMVLMAGYDLPVRAIRQQVASALDLIVHLERLRGRLAPGDRDHRGAAHGVGRDHAAGPVRVQGRRRSRADREGGRRARSDRPAADVPRQVREARRRAADRRCSPRHGRTALEPRGGGRRERGSLLRALALAALLAAARRVGRGAAPSLRSSRPAGRSSPTARSCSRCRRSDAAAAGQVHVTRERRPVSRACASSRPTAAGEHELRRRARDRRQPTACAGSRSTDAMAAARAFAAQRNPQPAARRDRHVQPRRRRARCRSRPTTARSTPRSRDPAARAPARTSTTRVATALALLEGREDRRRLGRRALRRRRHAAAR